MTTTTTEAQSAEHMGTALAAVSEVILHAVGLYRAGKPVQAMDHISWYAEQAGVLDSLATDEPITTVEYAIRYTEHSAFDGREYVATRPLGSSSAPEAATAALEQAARMREYQTRAGLPVDAVALVCMVITTPWEQVAGVLDGLTAPQEARHG